MRRFGGTWLQYHSGNVNGHQMQATPPGLNLETGLQGLQKSGPSLQKLKHQSGWGAPYSPWSGVRVLPDPRRSTSMQESPTTSYLQISQSYEKPKFMMTRTTWRAGVAGA